MPRPEVTAHLTAISELVGAMGEPSEMPGYYLDVIAIYDRCRSMFGGLRTLLSADFSHEAAVLAGPLFVDSLVLAEFAAADEPRRAQLVIGLELQGVRDAEGIVRAAARQARGQVRRLFGLIVPNLNLERFIVERDPGPWNFERWAGNFSGDVP